MKIGVLIAVLVMSGCADSTIVHSSVTPFTPHVSRTNAEIIARYKEARESGFSHGSAYQYARGDKTYTSDQLEVIGLNEMLNEPSLV